MKFLSNFDTKLEWKLLEQYQQMFGDEYVMSIHKSKFYYYAYIGLPFLLYIACVLVSIYVAVFVELPLEAIYQDVLLWVVIGVAFLVGIWLMRKVSGKYVDYKMDFMIITPKEIIKYDQTGVLKRDSEMIHADKIKSISISKSGFMNSLFDMGTLVFLAEGNDEKWDIVMPYVDAVEAKEKTIKHVLGLDTV